MEEAKQPILAEQQDIKRLLEVLLENNMQQEHGQVEGLVTYLDNMENQFDQMLSELKEMKEELHQIKDRGIRKTAFEIMDKVESKVQEMGQKITMLKTRFIHSAKQAVMDFQEKGKSALKQAVTAMKIPSALSYLKNHFKQTAEGMSKEVAKIELLSQELHSVKEHTKNIGRVVMGKSRKEPEAMNPDKGILAKWNKVLLSCSNRFAVMEKSTNRAINWMETPPKEKEKKSSIQKQLKGIRLGKAKQAKGVELKGQEQIR